MKKYILFACALILQTVISYAFDGDNEKLMEMSVLGKMCENPNFEKSCIPFYPSNPERSKSSNKLPTIVEEPIIEEQILLIQNGNEGIVFIFRTLSKGHPIIGG